MAKLNHVLFGQAKGKVGGMVLQRYEGMNIAREKPISVKNPQSEAQTNQRAKFKMASQITAEFKEVILARLSLLSIYDRTKRSASVNAILGVINDTNPSSPHALVNDVVAAINEKSVSGMSAPALDNEDDIFTIVATNSNTVVYVCCGYASDGHLIDKQFETYTSDGTGKEVTPNANANTSAIMVVELHALTDEGRATLSNTSLKAGQFQLEVSRGITAGDIEVSNMAGSFIFNT